MSRVPVPLALRWLRWTGVVVVTGVIVYFSILKSVPTPPSGPGPIRDKRLHFAAYADLAYTFAYATVDWQHRPGRRIGGVLASALLVGVTIELVQGVLPMRYYGVADLLANCIGASLVGPWFLVELQLQYVELRDTLLVAVKAVGVIQRMLNQQRELRPIPGDPRTHDRF